MRAAISWILAISAATGCVTHHRVVVLGRQLHESMEERHARGQSVVQASDLAGENAMATTAVVKRGDTVGFTGGARLRLEELERGCPAAPAPLGQVATEADCPLVQLADSQFELRRYQTRDARPVVGGVVGGLILGALAGAVVCEYKCDDPSTPKLASDIVLGSLAVVLVGGLIWAILDCSGRWGQAGCRD
jgi:hypothetical protein